jgi:hypothetical protein
MVVCEQYMATYFPEKHEPFSNEHSDVSEQSSEMMEISVAVGPNGEPC